MVIGVVIVGNISVWYLKYKLKPASAIRLNRIQSIVCELVCVLAVEAWDIS